MVKLGKKIRGFTLLESMVAIVIVMLVFSFSSIIIISVTTSGMTREKQNAYLYIKQTRNKTLQQHLLLDETTKEGELTIVKSILNYDKSEQLNILMIEVFKGTKKITSSQEIIFTNKKEE